jgi:hypothetical protein
VGRLKKQMNGEERLEANIDKRGGRAAGLAGRVGANNMGVEWRKRRLKQSSMEIGSPI